MQCGIVAFTLAFPFVLVLAVVAMFVLVFVLVLVVLAWRLRHGTASKNQIEFRVKAKLRAEYYGSNKSLTLDMSRNIFLSAEWRDLAMLNYAVDPKLLTPHVPPGTTLDSFEGKTYVSLVGFRFCRTKLFDLVPVPFHTDFEEVNLRFYVRRREDGEERRGVVFIAEIVPKRAVAQLARLAYAENYVRFPMDHTNIEDGATKAVEYRWRLNSGWCKLRAQSCSAPAPAGEGSLEQFITEHYWGYSKQRNGATVEYQVEHVPWKVWESTSSAGFDGDASGLYGRELGQVLQRGPDSAFIADGSPIAVFRGRRIGPTG
jgi:uncharacterized protein